MTYKVGKTPQRVIQTKTLHFPSKLIERSDTGFIISFT